MKTKLFYLMMLMVMSLPIIAENNSLPKDSSSNCNAYYTYRLDSIQTNAYQFFGEATGTAPFQYHWNFGDGNYSNLQNPVHSFNHQGSFYVCLTISTNDSCYSSYCSFVGVDSLINPNCQAMFYALTDSNLNSNTFRFIDASLGNINSWLWNFGDGVTSTLQNPEHTYNNNGTFPVCLTINSLDSGVTCTDTYCQNVFVGQSSSSFILSGIVKAGNSTIDAGVVSVYAVDSAYMFVNSTPVSDSIGYYSFLLPQGRYIVKAELSPNSIYFGHYTPTYHLNALNWQQATNINLTHSIYNANVEMIYIDSVSGIGSINGRVIGNKNILPSNAEILLVNNVNQPVCYTKTNNSGYFSLNSLSINTYKVYAEIPGYNSSNTSVNLTLNNPNANGLIISLTPTAIKPISLNKSKVLVYPNPVVDILNLESNIAENYEIDICIYNAMGVKVYGKACNYYKGKNKTSIDTKTWANGVYFIKIISSDKSISETYKVIK